jgi:hypothetical protein
MKTITSIKKYFALPLAFYFAQTAQAQLLNETFDSSAGFTITDASGPSNFFSDGSNDFFGIYDGDGDGGADFGTATTNPSGQTNYSSSGDNYLVNEDMDPSEGVDLPATLTWPSISLSGETLLNISADFASSRADADDYIIVSYRVDSGAWTDIIGVAGASGTNGPVYEITDFSAKNGDASATAITTTFTNISGSLTLAGTETTLDIKAEFSNNNGDDNFGMDNLVVEESTGSEEAITLSSTATTVDEGTTLAITLTVPTSVSADTIFNLSSTGDGSELSIPATATILAGTNTIDFNVSGLSDSVFDGDNDVTITADLTGYISTSLSVTVVDAESRPPLGDIIFTQYYEGSGNNKWVEITNTGTSPVDLSSYEVTLWNNATTEAWKTSGETPYKTLSLSGVTLDAGVSYVIANTSSSSPYSSSLADVTSEITYFNGDDSLVLYSDPTGYLVSNILDAIAFTDAGNEGANKGFIRTAASYGFDLATGSSIEDYDDDNSGPAVWTEITTATADSATLGDDAYIGSTSLVVAPASVSFTTVSQSLAEADGNIAIAVQAVSLTSGTVTVQVDFNADNSTADLTDISYPTAQQLTFDATSLVSPQTITIPIADDGLDGSTEIASFDLSIISGTASLAAPSTQNVSITDSDFVIPDLIISEVADPNDNYNGRFVELYNPTDSTIDLAAGNWHLTKFVNANTSRSSVALTGSIASGATYVISGSGFSAAYDPLTVDQAWNSASGNGDDTYALYYGGNNTTGTLVDILGVIGTDGTGEAWNYEDGRAVRNADVTSPSATINVSEWTFYSDESTTNQPATNGIANVADMTPGVHPDVSVGEPTGVVASAVSDTEISVAFAAINSNDVIIVFDADNTFTAPSGSAPSLGDSFAGGTVIYVGQVSPFAHTGLTASTQYYYSVFSVNGTDYSTTVEANATTQVAGLINSEAFATASAQWTPQAIAGTSAPGWDNDNSGTAAVDGYVLPSGSASTEIHYLVSPELDFSSVTGTVTVSLDYEGAANTVDDSLKLVYSTSYAGSGDPENPNTWAEVDFTFVNTNSGSPTSVLNDSAEITLPSSLNGQSTVYLALRYEAGGEASNSEYWTIDNILVVEAAAADPVADYLTARSLTSSDLTTDSNGNGFTVLEEYLAGFGDGSGPDAISYGIDNDALTLTSDLESAPSGITVVLEATSDLSVAFAPVAFTASVVDNTDGTYTRSYTETSPPAGDQRFLRLSITTD